MPQSRRTSLEPYWKSDCGRAVVYLGDCLKVMEGMERNQFHAVVTDPPYNLSFMNNAWDSYRTGVQFQEWFLRRAEEMLRVAKPGAHLLSFGGSRMWHRMACAVEDAEWEIRDTIMWLYGSGFPKSQDLSKAIDKMLGAEREVVGEKLGLDGSGFGNVGHGLKSTQIPVTTPNTDAARQWNGWGSCLKPAHEPVVLARKPMPDSTARCVMENGTGALNVDGCRVGTTGEDVTRSIQSKSSSGSGVYQFNSGEAGSQSMKGGFSVTHKDGRWPANVIITHHHECRVVGKKIAKGAKPHTWGASGGTGSTFKLSDTTDKKQEGQTWQGHPDTEVDDYECHPDCPVQMLDGDNRLDGASRYFYTAKANGERDRPHGKGEGAHPTVKPLDLMQYLCRLVCARGGTVLDPFMGSGSTGCAALEEGMKFVGVEQSQEYADIAVGRLKLALAKVRPEDVPDIEATLATGRRINRSEPPPPTRLE